ncbi:SPFH domain-containing protein [Streptacidiphilus monticola]
MLAAALAGACAVQADRAALPTWLPGSGRLNADAPSLHRPEAALLLGLCGVVAVTAFFGLMTNPLGTARVLSRWGGYRGTVRRTGLVWVNPLLKRRPLDVRIRHWRSAPLSAVDREGSPIRAELLLVWQIRDTARARFAVDDHEQHLAVSAESVLSRVASTLPCDSFATPGPSLRDGQWLGGELTRLLAAEMAPVGVAVFSAQAVVLDYAPDFAAAMRRRRIAELEAGTRDIVVGDALETASLAVSHLERHQGGALDPAVRAELLRDLVTAFLAVPVSVPASAAAAPREQAHVEPAAPGSAAHIPDRLPAPVRLGKPAARPAGATPVGRAQT